MLHKDFTSVFLYSGWNEAGKLKPCEPGGTKWVWNEADLDTLSRNNSVGCKKPCCCYCCDLVIKMNEQTPDCRCFTYVSITSHEALCTNHWIPIQKSYHVKSVGDVLFMQWSYWFGVSVSDKQCLSATTIVSGLSVEVAASSGCNITDNFRPPAGNRSSLAVSTQSKVNICMTMAAERKWWSNQFSRK